MLEPGQNCWRVAVATRATVIIDADDYFRAARAAMLKAKKQILLIGWDFDARIRFKVGEDDSGPEEVGKFISWLVRRTPGLQVHILRWDTGALKTLTHGRTLVRLAKWWKDQQVHLRFDTHHPIGGSHHQKVVVIDDDVAFCGGIDITVERWDTRRHADVEPRRREPNGKPYGPWHDATTILEGPVASALGELCRSRWAVSGGTELKPVTGAGRCWPEHVKPDFTDVEVGIARTVPEMAKQEPRHEIEALYIDLVAKAKRWIYAESQYFASRKVAEAIAKRLSEPDGPEIVIVHPESAEGWLEPVAMDSARARLVGALQDQDPYRRLRLYHAFTAGGQPIYVHAKVMVIDDEILRVGSSNFNNRSLKLDTECDIVIDASIGANVKHQRKIAGIRNSLMAEHLGTDCETIEQTMAETGSIIGTIEKLCGDGRTLRPYQVPDLSTVRTWLADNKILDPEGPGEMFESIFQRRDLLHHLRRRRQRRRKDAGFAPLLLGWAIGGAMLIVGTAALLKWQQNKE